MPGGKQRFRMGTVVAIALHVALVMLFLWEKNYGVDEIAPIQQGAGGPGPAGGGGGRSSPRLEFIQFVEALPVPPPTPKPTFVFKPPEIKPPPPPVVEQLPIPEPVVASGTSTSGSAVDPTAGAGPGSGGGVGSGIGTGKGSSVGPGTGGGNGENYPPTPAEMYLPPLPVPAGIRGFKVIAEFDVDEKGKVISFKFTETRDRGYNRRLQDVLKTYRFRPGTRPDGTPIRMKAQVTIDLP